MAAFFCNAFPDGRTGLAKIPSVEVVLGGESHQVHQLLLSLTSSSFLYIVSCLFPFRAVICCSFLASFHCGSTAALSSRASIVFHMRCVLTLTDVPAVELTSLLDFTLECCERQGSFSFCSSIPLTTYPHLQIFCLLWWGQIESPVVLLSSQLLSSQCHRCHLDLIVCLRSPSGRTKWPAKLPWTPSLHNFSFQVWNCFLIFDADPSTMDVVYFWEDVAVLLLTLAAASQPHLF